MKTKIALSVALSTALLAGCNPEPRYEQSSGKVVASYFGDWQFYTTGYTPTDIPGGDLTHVIYGFLSMCGPHEGAAVSETVAAQVAAACEGKEDFTAIVVDQDAAYGYKRDGERYVGHFKEFKSVKRQFPHLKILPSFGGWTMSEPFHEMIKTEEGRQHFASTAVALIDEVEIFDGIDLDWEYPGGGGATVPQTQERIDAEKDAFTDLLAKIRVELDALSEETGRYYELTSAVGAAKGAGINFAEASPLVDYWFGMTYDFFGAWHLESIGHQSNVIGSGDVKWWSGIDGYVLGGYNGLIGKWGLPAEKLVLGAPFYGRGWTGVTEFGSNDDSKPQPFLKNAEGGFPKAEAGITIELPYNVLKEEYINKNGWVEYYDEQHKASYLWNEELKGYITFDNAQAILDKGEFIAAHGFAGIYSWEITNDKDSDLTDAMNDAVGNIRIAD